MRLDLDKRFVFIVNMLLIVFFICGCFNRDLLGRKYAPNEVVAIAENEIPFVSKDSHFNKGDMVEADSFGRVLYAYQSVDSIGIADYTGCDQVFVYIIYQKFDSKNVYYYPGACYLFTKEYKTVDEKALENLKIANDWNCSYDVQKTVKLALNYSLVSYNETRSVNLLETVINKELIQYVFDCVSISEQGWLFILREYEKSTDAEELLFGNTYVFYVSFEYQLVDFMKLEKGIVDWPQQIYEFKEKNDFYQISSKQEG